METGPRGRGPFLKGQTHMLIRVGDRIVNMDNVMTVELDVVYDDDEEDEAPRVIFEFVMRGWDELDKGANVAEPYVEIFEGEQAEAVRKHLKQMVPDLLAK
jgi:hypothetical protein